MPEHETKEKKSRYTPSQAKAAKRYLTENVEDIKIRVRKGEKMKYKEAAANAGESLNTFIIKAMNERIEKENLL
ncbi:hypothetical protein SAMN06297422_101200 [Lachnospiraceae bacterium]|jgi:predicted HicB family RNase H-like nuclease|nr:hypothetical protein SAMN06297422_101200 [Lachnospiraceae bacterium]